LSPYEKNDYATHFHVAPFGGRKELGLLATLLHRQKKNLIQLINQIERIGKKGVSLTDALQNSSKIKVVITFDNGAQQLKGFAIPELLNRGMTASIFIPTHHISKTNAWGVEEGRAKFKLMDESAIRELHKLGMEIRGHSGHHIHLGDVQESHSKNCGCRKRF